jgi:enediyne polyketide synthase
LAGSELYESLLFQRGRFRRLAGYRSLSAWKACAEVSSGAGDWFAPYLPATLVLGDPGARDAVLHSLQACVPGARLLPVAVERLSFAALPSGPITVYAHERRREGDTFVYDVDVRDAGGDLVERWEGLALRVVAGSARRQWSLALLPMHLERHAADVLRATGVRVAIDADDLSSPREQSDRALGRILEAGARVNRAPDGRPRAERHHVSTSHARGWTLAVIADSAIGCDVEAVAERPSSAWREVLGSERMALVSRVANQCGENESTAATRVWTAAEALKKCGGDFAAPLVLASAETGGWLRYSSGTFEIASWVAPIVEAGACAFAFAAPRGGHDARV